MITLGSSVAYIFMGCIMGIIDSWNRKVMFSLCVVGIGLSIYFYLSNPGDYVSDITILEFVVNVFFVGIGVFLGEENYKYVFGEK